MADESDDRKRAALWPWMLGLLLAPVFYVLSTGPVVAYGIDTIGRDNLRTFYAPVVWLHEHTPLAGPLEKYWAWWGVK